MCEPAECTGLTHIATPTHTTPTDCNTPSQTGPTRTYVRTYVCTSCTVSECPAHHTRVIHTSHLPRYTEECVHCCSLTSTPTIWSILYTYFHVHVHNIICIPMYTCTGGCVPVGSSPLICGQCLPAHCVGALGASCSAYLLHVIIRMCIDMLEGDGIEEK